MLVYEAAPNIQLLIGSLCVYGLKTTFNYSTRLKEEAGTSFDRKLYTNKSKWQESTNALKFEEAKIPWRLPWNAAPQCSYFRACRILPDRAARVIQIFEIPQKMRRSTGIATDLLEWVRPL